MENTPADQISDHTPTKATVAQQASQMLEGILQRMGYELEVETQIDDDRIVLDIVGDAERELIGAKGQTLDALQYILARAVNTRGIKCPIIVDDGGYRERRKEALTELARTLLEEAVSSQKTLSVNPMSAHDRRVIHMALKEEPRVATHSEGDGIYRRVIVVPVGD